MNKLLLTIGILLLISCKKKQKLNLADVLKSDCLWDRTGESGVIGGLNSDYKFLPNGQCFFYYYKFRNQIKSDSAYKFEDTDIILPNSWSVVGDSLLTVREIKFNVLDFAKDSVLVVGNMNDTMVLRKNCKTILDQ